ncbi:SUMF1/EgtB/PvdO family nonheme iron enzyme [Aquisphaera insulae]|uniref:SUMF1/EgtB/PvdO family nonheme iron enzyme n=1 Tax=Aquisphaera insulae TaxID=2712864 RepID=UPI0013ECF33D|nr:SUMF1/EgtB/PvdO family nonheme iron enzyme [Aquisphaera insulae]
MNDHESGEYGLADLPEEPAPKPKPVPSTAGKPLPRLWKDEVEPEGADKPPGRTTAGRGKDAAGTRSESSAEPRRRSGQPAATRGRKEADDGPKRVLVEDTPALDTYDARQKGRILIGGLFALVFGLVGYVVYALFLYDPMPMTDYTGEEPPSPAAASPALAASPSANLEIEARSMLDRARDSAKAGRTDEAIRVLETVAKTYSKTKVAAEAKEALARPSEGMPLFLDRPAVKADAPAQPPPAEPAEPPAIVQAAPPRTGGPATLTLPANASEVAPTKPSPLAMAGNNAAPGNATISPPESVSTPAHAPTPAARQLPPPAGFRAKPEAGYDESGWPLVIVGDRDGAPMVFVPGGVITLGDDAGAGSRIAPRQVELTPYYMDQHEVTLRQFKVFLGETRYKGQPPRSWSDEYRTNPNEQMPLTMVNLRDATAFAEWAGKKIPSEAQWELAARSTDGRTYPWGNDPAKGTRPPGAIKFDPAGAFPADVSAYGVLDLGGNVLEWTRDPYDARSYRDPAADGSDSASFGRLRTFDAVVKGDRKVNRASFRQGINADKRMNYVGFRCVLPVTAPPAPVAASPVPTPPAAAPAAMPAPPAAQPNAPASTPAAGAGQPQQGKTAPQPSVPF